MLDKLNNVLARSNLSGITYAELRYHSRERLHIHARRGELEDSTKDVYAGVGIRVLQDGSWGFSATSLLDFKSLQEKLEEAQKIAKITASQKKTHVKLAPVKPIEGCFRANEQDPLRDHSIEDKIDLVLNSDKKIRKGVCARDFC